jgi:hypothetical protein
MANDRQVIQYMTPAELVALMNATGVITVNEAGMSDGKPVIHAAVKVVNAETGEHLPGGLPFSVVMFKGPNEPGYSNIAIGTIVPAQELNVALPRDYFNFCNQRFRFTRVFPVDERSFVIQMDLVLKNATREYVKFGFGLWGALFSQMLFELMGRGRESLISAAEAYAQAHTDFAQQIATTPEAAVAEPVPTGEPVIVPETAEAGGMAEADAILPLEAEAIIPQETGLDAEAPKVDEAPAENTPVVEAEAVIEAPAEETVAMAEPVAEDGEAALPVEIAVEVPEAAAEELELSIAAGPAAETLPEAESEIVAPAAEPAGEAVAAESGEAKEAVPA